MDDHGVVDKLRFLSHDAEPIGEQRKELSRSMEVVVEHRLNIHAFTRVSMQTGVEKALGSSVRNQPRSWSLPCWTTVAHQGCVVDCVR